MSRSVYPVNARLCRLTQPCLEYDSSRSLDSRSVPVYLVAVESLLEPLSSGRPSNSEKINSFRPRYIGYKIEHNFMPYAGVAVSVREDLSFRRLVKFEF